MKDLSAMTDSELADYLDFCETQTHIQDKSQHATKILLNSLYGALGTQYFRMYDVKQAEGITLSGQAIVSQSYEVMNDFLNSTLKSDKDWVIASDTDSAYVNFSELMEQLTKGIPQEKHVDIMQKITDDVIAKKLTAKFDEFAVRTNAMFNNIDMKREAIASACFVAKKNYVMLVYDNEGTRYASPKQKITGLEAIKSSTPKYFKDKLKKGYSFVFDRTEAEIHKFVKDVYDEYMKLPAESLAAVTSVSEIEKYLDGTSVLPGTPYNAKAAILYNQQIDKLGLREKYVKIKGGDKIKIVNLIVPNPLHGKYFAWIDKFPHEIIHDKFINRELNYRKYFVDPLMRVLSVVGWKHEYAPSLEDFFN